MGPRRRQEPRTGYGIVAIPADDVGAAGALELIAFSIVRPAARRPSQFFNAIRMTKSINITQGRLNEAASFAEYFPSYGLCDALGSADRVSFGVGVGVVMFGSSSR